MPPGDPDISDDAELRRFANEVRTPLMTNASVSL